MRRPLLALCALAVLAGAARAVRPGPGAAADARRFGLDRLMPQQRRTPSDAAKRALAAFRAASGGGWKATFSPRTGLPDAITGGREAPRGGGPEAAARAFLTAHQDLLGADPTALAAERVVRGDGHRHVLYRQNYRGIPVEFSAVKVHLDEQGAVTGVNSSYEPAISVPTVPRIAIDVAARAAQADAGAMAAVRGAPTLVVVPLETTGRAHLAWKMRVDGVGGSWRYYVDALTGQVLFRYGIQRFQAVCLTSGVVAGMVYDIDPTTTPIAHARPFNNQYVYVADGSDRELTHNDPTFGGGFFCGRAIGKVNMSLQGPFISVSEFRGRNAHYDNGQGAWTTLATPISSPHPYPNSAVVVSTIDLSAAAPNAVSFLPLFSDFHVGKFDGGSGEGTGDILDDDRLDIYDGADNPIASYIGDRAPFNAAEVHTKVMHLAILSNASGQNTGYDIGVSSYMTFPASAGGAFTYGAPSSSHVWTAADTMLGLSSEVNLFYHLNQMHDYFMSDVDKSSAAPITKPMIAMAHVGPNLLNAFYDPDYDDISFGDVNTNGVSDLFTLDATVPHHEYVHYLVEKIWSIQNFGQAGAISEAVADYFSASSLNHSSIGTFVLVGLGGSGPLRELDCGLGQCFQLGNPATPWTGEIHSDSPFVSQALWDIRRDRIANLGPTLGRSCADGLVFQSLLFFPESFAELYRAMVQVDKGGYVAACGGPSTANAIITGAFGAHGLLPVGGDAYEPNDGFETATDVSTLGVVNATIYPAADTDFYSFGAGPGLVHATLRLPFVGNSLYKAYQLKLYNASRVQVAGVEPPYNGFGTLDGICDITDCETTSPTVQLGYNNPAGGLLYLQVIGGTSLNGSNSGVNSTIPYSLAVAFTPGAALSASIVSAQLDGDQIAFTVNGSTFVSNQDMRFAYAQLRNEGYAILPNTLTHVPTLASDYLALASSANASGRITGSVRLMPGFSGRFPAAGTVYLEVFGYDVLGSTVSLGLSNPVNLTAGNTELTAYNNLFNPLNGQKATVKYAVNGSGRLTIRVYTVAGQHVVTLFDDAVPAGKGSVEWDGRNLAGNVVASGVYVVRANGPGLKNQTQKIAVVK